eukprot:1278382-Rhodomonas_salina.2
MPYAPRSPSDTRRVDAPGFTASACFICSLPSECWSMSAPSKCKSPSTAIVYSEQAESTTFFSTDMCSKVGPRRTGKNLRVQAACACAYRVWDNTSGEMKAETVPAEKSRPQSSSSVTADLIACNPAAQS